MTPSEKKSHWESIYSSKETKECSWFQPVPEVAIDIIKKNNLKTHSRIIDVGAGESFLVDYLLAAKFENISLLDISETALMRKKNNLGENARNIEWIVSNILDFNSNQTYDFWHDRATFHFLTKKEEIEKYVSIVEKHLHKDASLFIGTFSQNGPTKCSGIEIKQYSEEEMTQVFADKFSKIECKTVDHETPTKKIQNFTFCHFKKK